VLANATAVTLAASAATSFFTQNVTLTATVAPDGTPVTGVTGTVSFYDNGAFLGSNDLTDGVTTFTVSALDVGSHSITAVYQGSDIFDGSSSAPLTETVLANNTVTTLAASAAPIHFTQSVTFTATVSPSGTPVTGVTGTVWFFDNGNSLGSADVTNGVASITVDNLDVGTHNVTAEYGGDGVFVASSSDPVSVTVLANATTITLAASAANSHFTEDVTFTASVVPSNTPLSGPTGTVRFFDNGNYVGSADVTDGVASITINNLDVGDHNITAEYLGDPVFTSSSSDPIAHTVLTNDTAVALDWSGNPANVVFTATVTPSGTPVTGVTGTVNFYDNGVYLGSADLTDGVATFAPGTLNAGIHSITAEYVGNSVFLGSTSDPLSITI
jgi:hypothetical protein